MSNLRDKTVAQIAEAHGIRTALVLVARVVDARTLPDVGADHGITAAEVRQIEARGIRTMSAHLFDMLTRAAQESRPGFGWHESVQRQRQRSWVAVP